MTSTSTTNNFHNGQVRADPEHAIVRRHVTSVQFGLYTDQDVRDRSVVEVTSPISYMNDTPLPGGLHDPKMGPSSQSDHMPCSTCARRFQLCPGHFGCIEVCVPLYQPLLWNDLLSILRSICFHCHKLRHFKRKLLQAHAKLLLILHNRLFDFYSLERELAQALLQAGEQDEQDESSKHTRAQDKLLQERAVETHCQAIIDELKDKPLSSNQKNTNDAVRASLFRDFRKQIMAEWRGVPQCRHCNAHNPKIKQDQSNKVFQIPVSDKSQQFNSAQGIEMVSALETLQNKQQKNKNAKDKDVESDEDTVMSETDRNPFIDDEAMEDDDHQNNITYSDDDEEQDGFSNKQKQRKTVTNSNNSTATKTTTQFYMPPSEVMAQLQLLWANHSLLLDTVLFAGHSPTKDHKLSYKTFFVNAIAVPPSRFRPPMTVGSMVAEHAQNDFLSKVLIENAAVRQELFLNNNEPRAHTHWIQLQTYFNCFMDSSKDPAAKGGNQTQNGIRQLLEKKQGIFRKNMMGKRVDSSCRSVISPDPYIGTNEIGIPVYFAQRLTYPTPVTEWNMTELRRLVERGPKQYPGAVWVDIPKPDGKKVRVNLDRMNPEKRQAVGAMLLTHGKSGGGSGRPAVVGRQLRHGDVMLVNRQPTLHKPGIMAHQVRILHDPNQKTIRMHYANCNTYNADFDGDEMNCHFPQSDVARAEATYIAQTDLQYIVPTDGSPLRGLIQDHVCGGVKLTTRDTFLKRWEYQQLLFATLASLPRLEVLEDNQDIELLPPAILKPVPLWTGKQVVTTLLLHLCNSPRGKKHYSSKSGMKRPPDIPLLRQGGLSLERSSKMPGTAFGEDHEEHLVLIRDGELLRGILDKSAFGASDFSLVHGVYEAYGPTKAGLLLNSLGRLFTSYIQCFAGHSCRVEDLILTPETDKIRRDLVQRAYNVGSRACKAWADSEGGKVAIESISEKEGSNKPLKPVEVASASAKISRLLGGAEGKQNFAALDGYMMSQLNPLASEIVKKCLPNGLAVPFPANTFGLMTTTGAKGSIVNQSQVSCALGQQALEGRRVPRLNSGRTLPSFAPYDLNPRADGFVMDRFLTGVRPQEYYFHCMAGREGLVDTAVKTSRSGYLQRCLVKHLEELKVCYDFTVRNGEGGVVQFLYGEDALDPTKASYLDCTDRSFEFMARNHDSIKTLNTQLQGCSIDLAASDHERSEALTKRSDSYLLREGESVLARRLRGGTSWKRGALLKGWHAAVITKTREDEGLVDLKYLKDGHRAKRVPMVADLGRCGGKFERALSGSCVVVKPAVADPILSAAAGSALRTRGDGRTHLLGSTGACLSERVAGSAKAVLSSKRFKKVLEANNVSSSDVGNVVAAKYANALCAPGEAVGSIAAQSVGEPSTQMTLNTFHLAGAGANVTLGIPRLREIIMTASKTLKTPTMSVPLQEIVTEDEATRLTRSFTKLTLMELIAGHRGVTVKETLRTGENGQWQRAYLVTLKFHPEERIKAAFGLSLHDIATSLGKSFNTAVKTLMVMELKRSKAEGEMVAVKVGGGRIAADFDVDADDEAGEEKEEGVELNTKMATNDDSSDDDDESSDGMGIEDGVAASKKRSEDATAFYDDDDDESEEDEPQPTEMDQADGYEITENQDDDEKDDTTTGSKSRTMTDGGVIVDKSRNCLHLDPLTCGPSARPLLMVGLIEKVAAKHLVSARKNIDQAFVNQEDGRGRCLQFAGVNFQEIWELDSSVVDHDRLMSNDTWAIRRTYGVEAARNNIVEQIRSVFGAYGIEVDPRHLSLIGDYMTNEGGYKPMNRIGMEQTGSTLLQMSFETTAHFLTQAACIGRKDNLDSPSANIVLGRPIKHGTGAFDVLVNSSA
ncbi:DNA-directed RNA polymerase subunit beta' (Fragment) [Seminavis robusta]|uniref:DNA-directed RNA polymerase subunit n=1 Tax=Seminavis robusta TaxID=568900 RepID=A0A9N8DPP6_9STRA